MSNKNGAVVNIGLNVDYTKSLDAMVTDFKSNLTLMANEAKKSKYAVEMTKQIDEISNRVDGLSKDIVEAFEKINGINLNSENFDDYQKHVAGNFEEIEKKITGVYSTIDVLNKRFDSIDVSKIKKEFDDLSESVIGSYNEISNIIGVVRKFSDSTNIIDTDVIKQATIYKEALKEIKKIKDNMETPDDIPSERHISQSNMEKAVNAYKGLVQQLEELEDKEAALFDEYSDSSGVKQLEAEKDLYITRQKMVVLLEIMQDLYDRIGAKNSNGLLNPKDVQAFDTDEYIKKATDFVRENEKMVESFKETQSQVDASITEFKVKNGAIHVPIKIDSVSTELKRQLQETLNSLQKEADNTTIIAKVKLTLDSGAQKKYKKNAEMAKQQTDGQNEPGLDIAGAINKAHIAAARESEAIVKKSIKKIRDELTIVKVPVEPDAESFIDKLNAIVNNSLKKISKEKFKLNINKELEQLVTNLKEVSESLTGNEKFKFGIDEDAIERITKAINGMANMIQRAFGVASDDDINAQWSVIENKFKSAAGESGQLLKKNKEQKIAIQEIAVEYKKYLDMGGNRELTDLTQNGRAIRNIREEYEKLNAEAVQTQNVLGRDKDTEVNSQDINNAIAANENLASQAEKTAISIIDEGDAAQYASERLRELTKEKKEATEANLELGIAAELTAEALKKEVEFLKEAEKTSKSAKPHKNAVGSDVYSANYSNWQRDIRQSLIDSGDYEDVYGAKISQGANGLVKFTAFVREHDEEWKMLTATVNNYGEMVAPKIQDATDKQKIAIEKAREAMRLYQEALAFADGEGGESTSYNREQLEEYIKTILEAEDGLDKFKIKKVALNDKGKLAITTEFKEASGQVKTFTANFDKVEDIIDETTGSVKNLSQILFVSTTKNYASMAKDAFEKFELSHKDDSNWSNVANDLDKVKEKIKTVSSQRDLDKIKNDLSAISTRLKNMKKDSNLGELFEGSTKSFSNIEEVKNELDSLFASIGRVDGKSIKVKDMNTLTAEIKQANGEIHKFTVTLDSVNFPRFVDNGVTAFSTLEKTSKGILSGIGNLVKMYISPQDFIRYFRQGFDSVKEIDTAMTELRKVSDASSSELAAYFDDAVESAKELGSTVKDMIAATADWSRMGYNLPDARKLGELAVLYKNVGDGIDVDEANSSLVSTLQGFQIDPEDAHKIIDAFNEVANNYAINSAGIGEALKRSAAAFNAANTDLNQAIALITAGNEIVQSPEKVGTMWQTVSARIRGKICAHYTVMCRPPYEGNIKAA